MPQIWLTYDELGEFLECGPAAAREACATLDLRRRRCSDGQTRAKLHAPLLAEYIAYLTGNLGQAGEQRPISAGARLRALAAEMRRYNTPLARRRA